MSQHCKGEVMKKYRKKPVVIEAWQFDKYNKENSQAITNWINGERTDQAFLSVSGIIEEVFHLEISTLESNRFVVSDGDFIIKGVMGEFYACKPVIFEMTYELEQGENK